MRQFIDLNFGWKFSDTFADEMTKANYDDSAFETVDIPHTVKELPYNYFDERDFQFISCYRKSFKLPAEAFENGRRVFINFAGAANYAKVYLNGKYVGEHKDGYTPFRLEITDKINKKNNTLAVELDSTERPDMPPFGKVVDYLVYGGIYREVSLEITEQKYIEDVFVKTPNALAPEKIVEADITFSESAMGSYTVELLDGDTCLKKKTADFDGRVIRMRMKAPGVSLWDIDSPKLYTLKVTYGTDVFTRRFGFREARFTRTGFELNGRKIKIVGLNRHQSYPYVGNAMPASAQRADADLLKYKLGCNFVRTSHYPDSVNFIDRCDEIGLLVFTEMPSWQYLGEGDWRETCLDNVRAMVKRDRSHPSIVLWGVRVNEGGDCDEFYKLTNEAAHSLDPTRQTGGVRNFPRSHLLEDVYTYNDFSHSGSFINLLPSFIVCGLKAPYLVTEHNGHMYPTKSFDREELRRNHAVRHANVQNAAFGSKRISGAIGWCMADYNTHKDFGSGDRICYHGVTDMFRVPKFAASVYASQQDNFPVLETSSAMDVGDYPGALVGGTYIFTNCDYVEVYKNGKHTSTAYPAKNEFPNLPHPPIRPADYVGDSLVTDDGLDEVTAKHLKKALVAATKYGYIMPPQNYLEIVYAYIHGRMSFGQMYDLIAKYFINWGDEQVTYRYDGYKDGKLVKSVTRTAVNSLSLEVKPDSDTLIEDKTYDVTRVELRCVDQNGNQVPYANHAIEVKVDGPAKVIGPDKFALIGGDRAFWLRTVCKSGTVTVTVTGQDLGEQSFTVNVIKK